MSHLLRTVCYGPQSRFDLNINAGMASIRLSFGLPTTFPPFFAASFSSSANNAILTKPNAHFLVFLMVFMNRWTIRYPASIPSRNQYRHFGVLAMEVSLLCPSLTMIKLANYATSKPCHPARITPLCTDAVIDRRGRWPTRSHSPLSAQRPPGTCNFNVQFPIGKQVALEAMCNSSA